MVKYMFEMPDDASFEMLYENLKARETVVLVYFIPSWYYMDNSIVIIDECQNLNFHK